MILSPLVFPAVSFIFVFNFFVLFAFSELPSIGSNLNCAECAVTLFMLLLQFQNSSVIDLIMIWPVARAQCYKTFKAVIYE